MISFLPVSGGFFTLANRCLSPAAVRLYSDHSFDSKGFVGGWSYWFARSVGLAVQLVAIQKVIAIWDPESNLSALWISLFLLTLILFNLLYVRHLGEIEYWLALIKLQGLLAIAAFGLLMSMGLAPGARQSGTSFDNSTVIPCSQAQAEGGQCLDPNVPGLECICPLFRQV
jgi:amino acid permease